MSELPGRDTLVEHVGDTFTIEDAEHSTFDAVLQSVSDLRSSGAQQQFSITFEVQSETDLEQSIYEITHESLPAMTLFLVPIGRNEKGLQMQAVFNNIVHAT